jgi:hypothetical protein
MAKVWFCRDGDNPTDGGPRAVLPLDDCAKTLGLTGADYIGGLTETPKFGKSGDPLAVSRQQGNTASGVRLPERCD